jgi:nucleoid DNA-binding protein
VTKAEIVDRIADGTGLTKLETEAVVDGLLYTIMEALESGESIELRGFGSFRVRERAGRVARNPQTDETIEVPRRFVPWFKPSRELARVVNEARIADETASRSPGAGRSG